MSLKNLLFVTISLLFMQQVSAQRNYDQYNLIGVWGGLALYDINTSNFVTDQGKGFIMGFTTRGAVYNNFDLIYGINFVQREVGIFATDDRSAAPLLPEQFVDYTISGAQISLLGSYNIVRDYLSLEFGPILDVNGKMKLKRDGFDDYLIDGYDNLRAKDISNISRVHVLAAGGITAGLRNFRLQAQYQYGLTNIFQRFNDTAEIEKSKGEFKGNASTIIVGAVFYF